MSQTRITPILPTVKGIDYKFVQVQGIDLKFVQVPSIDLKFATEQSGTLRPAVVEKNDSLPQIDSVIPARRAHRSKRGKIMSGIADLQADFEFEHEDHKRDQRKSRDILKDKRAFKKRFITRGFRGKLDNSYTGKERRAKIRKLAMKHRVETGTEHKYSGFNVEAAISRFNRTGKLPNMTVEQVRAAIVGPVGNARAMIEAMLMRSGIEPNPGMDSENDHSNYFTCQFAGKRISGEWSGIGKNLKMYCPNCSQLMDPINKKIGQHQPAGFSPTYEQLRDVAIHTVNVANDYVHYTTDSDEKAAPAVSSPPTKEDKRQERIAQYVPKVKKPVQPATPPRWSQKQTSSTTSPKLSPPTSPRPNTPVAVPVIQAAPVPVPAPARVEEPITLARALTNTVTRYGDFRTEVKNVVSWFDWFSFAMTVCLALFWFATSISEWSSTSVCALRGTLFLSMALVRAKPPKRGVPSSHIRTLMFFMSLPSLVAVTWRRMFDFSFYTIACDQLVVAWCCTSMCEAMYPVGFSEDWRVPNSLCYKPATHRDHVAVATGVIKSGFIAENIVHEAVISRGELLPSQRSLDHSTYPGLILVTRKLTDIGPDGNIRVSNQDVVVSSALVKLMRSRISCTLGNNYERVVLDLMRYAENQNSVQLPPDNDVCPIPISLASVHYLADQLFSVPANLNAGTACFY